MTSLRVSRKRMIDELSNTHKEALSQSMMSRDNKSELGIDEISFIVRINFAE
jgi:hypothetical protein